MVGDDGALTVTETITFAFDGSFRGAYRDIPVRSGEFVTSVSVSEGGERYEPGASTVLGSTDTPGTYGVADRGSFVRVVWHYRAVNEFRIFTVSYVMEGVAVAYDDIVDVNLQVWGGEWQTGLGLLDASMTLPGSHEPGDVRVWGHPAGVDGSVSLGDDGVSPTLRADGIGSHSFVELRVTFPRSSLTSTDGAKVVAGDGLASVLDQEAAFAAQAERDAELGRRAVWIAALLAVIPALAVIAGVYLRHGREPRVDYDREYEQEPPTDLEPALVSALLSQGKVRVEAWVATLFDLIRQGVLVAEPVSFEKATWLGMRTETITDLQLSLGDVDRELRDHERRVVTTMARVLADGPEPLSRLKERIRDDAAANAQTYDAFERSVSSALRRRKLLVEDGRIVLLVAAGLVVGAHVLLWFAVDIWLSRGPLTIMRAGLVASGITNLVLLGAFSLVRRGWARRTAGGAAIAARWEAFRRYLRDFSRLEDAPPVSLTLWDDYLVYGAALGVTDEVLAAARINAPVEVEQQSHIYWYANHGTSGGHSSDAFAGLSSALSGAFNPPSSSGGGGGFSGGGGGGGGGGAW